MAVTTETEVGEHTIAGRTITVVRITWRGQGPASYDLYYGEDLLTEESLDHYPAEAEIEAAARAGILTGNYCRFCGDDVGLDGHLIGAAEPGTNPWACSSHWDERLR
jgi:hypothetical protein